VLFQLTGNESWAKDKLKIVSDTAKSIALMQNFTDANTTKAEELTNETLETVQRTSCEEPKCSGHGNCVNGTCVCNAGKLAVVGFWRLESRT